MPRKPNYSHEKRLRDLAKQKKREEKRLRKQAQRDEASADHESVADADPANAATDAATDKSSAE